MTYFDPEVETISRDQLRALQWSKLQSMLDQIYGRNRFYTRKFESARISPKDLRSLDDLALLPLTTKSELMDAQNECPPLGSNATFGESAYIRLHQTSGTTGAPLRVLDTRESWDLWGRCWGHVFAAAGVKPGDRVFLPFSFGTFIGFWAAVEGAKQVGAMMIPGGGRDSHQRLQLMRDLGITVMCSTPTYALRLAEVAREIGFDLRQIPLRTTVHAGEPGANVPSTKARLESVWNARCFDHAGASEVGAHSFECEIQPGGTHVIESEFIVETLRPDSDQSAPDGEIGELVITNLGRIGFPVIRYRSGDLVRWNRSPCKCGRTFARFEGGILGRTDDMVIVRGVNVYPSALENLIFADDSVTEYRVVVEAGNPIEILRIEIEVSPGQDGERARERVENSIHYALALRPHVVVLGPGTLPRHELKSRRFHYVP